jgi:hypothetical protein
VSIENAERFLRRLEADSGLQAEVGSVGPDGFEAVTAAAGASCTAYELACAVVRQIERGGKEGE